MIIVIFMQGIFLTLPVQPGITDIKLMIADKSNEEALHLFRELLPGDSDNPDLHYGLAYTLDNYLDDPEKALISYTRFIKIASENADNVNEMQVLLNHAEARIRRIKEDAFFGNQ